MNEWRHVNDELLPENQLVIAITCFDDKTASWVCIGKVDPNYKHLSEYDYRTNIETTVGVGVHGIKWWMPIIDLPTHEDGEWLHSNDWLECKESPPPQRRGDPFHFILFDEEKGVAEAELWGRYQSETWSCKHSFYKPLFWRPFPMLPLPSFNVLQC